MPKTAGVRVTNIIIYNELYEVFDDDDDDDDDDED